MKNFRIIIGLMLLALLTLIGFQWYWIENAIAVKHDQFDRSVVASMNQAVTKIEKQEVMFLAKQKAIEQERLTLAALAETPKPKKKRIRVVKKLNPVMVAAETDILTINTSENLPAKNPATSKKPVAIISTQNPPSIEEHSIALPSEEEQVLIGQVPETGDSIYINLQPNNALLDLENVMFNIQLSDLYSYQNNRLPENRLRFIREMMQEQNLMWDQLNERGNGFANRGLDNVFDVIDQELSAFVNQRRESGRFPFREVKNQPLYTLEAQKPEVVFEHSGDTLNVVQKPRPPKLIPLNREAMALQIEATPIAEPEKEEEKVEYEWVEVEEEEKKTKDELSSLERTRNKAALVKDVFVDFIQGKRNIYERLNQEMLDTLLKNELRNNGIDLAYEYGVNNDGVMMFASYGLNNNPALSEDSYSVRLFPNDALLQQQFLYVHFPEKEGFLMGNMWTVFGSSILLIMLIGSIFYSSVSTMMEQKKLSMIKNDFINNMTHEFKTPISTISLAVEVMKDKGIQKNPEKYLNIIKDENSRLGSQVEKVLQMALLDKGEIKLNLTKVNIHEIIEQVGQNLSVQIENKNGQLELDLQAQNSELMADEVHMTNIVFNLLDNANKYSPEDPKISVATRDIDGGISVTINDQGKGMDKEELSNIFEKFYRVSTGNVHDVKGFGLGLSYVKKMVDVHHGNIEVSSNIGEGTTFILDFYKRT